MSAVEEELEEGEITDSDSMGEEDQVCAIIHLSLYQLFFHGVDTIIRSTLIILQVLLLCVYCVFVRHWPLGLL